MRIQERRREMGPGDWIWPGWGADVDPAETGQEI